MTDKQTLNIQWVYNKLQRLVELDDALNVKTINCLNYYRRLEEMSQEKTHEEVKKQSTMFSIFMKKVYEILKEVEGTNEAAKSIAEIKSKIEMRKQQIQEKLETFDAKKEASNLNEPMVMKSKKPSMDDAEEMAEKWLQDVKGLKQQVMTLNDNVVKGSEAIKQAKTNQDQVAEMLTKINKSLKNMLSNPDLGLIKLLVMTGIATLLFLFTALFILAF